VFFVNNDIMKSKVKQYNMHSTN